jgi:hypothetical protein
MDSMKEMLDTIEIHPSEKIEKSKVKLLNALSQLEKQLELISNKVKAYKLNEEYEKFTIENRELKNIVTNLQEEIELQKLENKNIRKITSEVMDEINDYILELEKIKKYHVDFTVKN